MKFDNRFLLVIISAIGLYAIFFMMSDLTIVYEKLLNFDTTYLPIILLLIPISWLILYLRWNLLLKHNDIKIPTKKNMEIYFSGFALSITPGKIGELLKSQFLKTKFDVPRKITAPLIIVEKIYHLIGLVIISILGVYYLDISSYIIIGATIFLVVGLVLLFSKKLFNKFLNLINKIKFISKWTDSLSESYDVVTTSLKGKTFVFATMYSVLFWLIESIIVFFILKSFEINAFDFFRITSTYIASIILGVLSFLPEGIGVVEGSLLGMFNVIGIETSLTFTVVVLIRVFTLWSSVVVGLISLKLCGVLSLNK